MLKWQNVFQCNVRSQNFYILEKEKLFNFSQHRQQRVQTFYLLTETKHQVTVIDDSLLLY